MSRRELMSIQINVKNSVFRSQFDVFGSLPFKADYQLKITE